MSQKPPSSPFSSPESSLPPSPVPTSQDQTRALAFWYGLINYEQRTPRPGDLKLDRMQALLRLLGHPERHLRLIHVAGSKGKGSTSAMLASLLAQAGYRTGLFTSPHLCRVEERIQVDGQPISPEELTVLLQEVRRVLESSSAALSPTFFEVATALGFLHFWRRRVDAAVLEVGLGGRFDSTNVCRPAVALITSISLDHTQQLGDNVTSIAQEKAGIIKPGRPTVSGVTNALAREVIEHTAQERGSPLYQLGVDFQYDYTPGRVTATDLSPPRVQVVTSHRRWPRMDLGLLGEHQAANAAVALSCVERLREQGWHISDQAVAAGLATVSWPARMEVVARRPLVVLDCAHNVASMEALVATLHTTFPPARRWLIFAASSDKDLSGMLRVLAPHFTHAFLTRYASSARGMPTEELAVRLRGVADLGHTLCATARDAWHAREARPVRKT